MIFPNRVDSIDVFRAFTMFLMIFVNDLWTLQNIPGWLGHSEAQEDAMGFADVIFPAFLFIVGLSVPFAIDNRKNKGDSNKIIIKHILERCFALLLMGLFLVNFENINSDALNFNKGLWGILMIIAFFLIWNVYPKDKNKTFYSSLKVLGYVILIFLASVYKGGEGEDTTWMQIHWWGILGMIGWAYLICSLLILFVGDNLITVLSAWIFLVVFNIASFAGWLSFLSEVKEYVWIVGDGAIPSFTMAGVFASVVYKRLLKSGKAGIFIFTMLVLAVVCIAVGMILRPFWGISKIRATPAWLEICTGISFTAYAVFFWLIDVKQKSKWFSILKPAGVATLTCYLIPYLWYPVLAFFSINLPAFLVTGEIGIVKSLIFSSIIVLITGGLNKRGIKLKV